MIRICIEYLATGVFQSFYFIIYYREMEDLKLIYQMSCICEVHITPRLPIKKYLTKIKFVYSLKHCETSRCMDNVYVFSTWMNFIQLYTFDPTSWACILLNKRVLLVPHLPIGQHL